MKTGIAIVSLLIIGNVSLLSGKTDGCNFKYFSPLRSDGKICFQDCLSEVIGYYGEFRSSVTYGHLHAGIDIRGRFCEPVYSIGEGEVIAVFREFPNKTVYIKHVDRNGSFTSVYIHVEDIQVQVGDIVSNASKIGRIFNRYELQDSDFHTSPHVHLEIRHCLADRGEATFSSMSLHELNRYSVNPITFLSERNRMK